MNLKDFDVVVVKMLGYASHLHTILHILTDTFNTGRTFVKETSQTAAYQGMLDEAIGVNTLRLLREKLATENVDADALYEETARYFQRHPIYIPAWRKSLAAVSDVSARVEMLKEFVVGNEAEKDMLCQMVDQRHPVSKALYERLFNARKAWERMLAQELSLKDAERVRAFLNSLSWLERRQFELSIGALANTKDRESVLNEALAAYPDVEQMREIALIRGLIKPSSIGKTTEEVVSFAKKLATPQPYDPAELAREQALLQAERDATRAAFARNPFARLFRFFRGDS